MKIEKVYVCVWRDVIKTSTSGIFLLSYSKTIIITAWPLPPAATQLPPPIVTTTAKKTILMLSTPSIVSQLPPHLLRFHSFLTFRTSCPSSLLRMSQMSSMLLLMMTFQNWPFHSYKFKVNFKKFWTTKFVKKKGKKTDQIHWERAKY